VGGDIYRDGVEEVNCNGEFLEKPHKDLKGL
jgi:hypothetical protein